MSKPIAFIIGAGKRIGASTAEVLQSKGYKVALAARSLKQEDSTDDKLYLTVDLSNPDSITPAFASLRKQWGEPSVVFYNGMHVQCSLERPSDH
jgi:NAD(P)-dependent dehydrogenase (short-subunit alcohol dehydrogenase family)